MSERLLAELQRLERALVRHDAPLVGLLRPPVAREDETAAEAEVGFPLSADVKTFFGWHDGNDPDPGPMDKEAIGATGLRPLGLKGALEVRQESLVETQKPFLEDFAKRWHDRWLPVLQGGPVYAVWVSCLTPTSQQVLIGDVWSGVGCLAPSLADVIEYHARMLEDDVWEWGTHQHWGWDDRRWPQADTQGDTCKDLRAQVGEMIDWDDPMHPTS